MTACANAARRLIFTDLDGSLLDHHSYRHDAAAPLLEELELAGVPVVFVSSKTRFEIEALREQLGNRHPFIAENGAAICVPEGYFSAPPPGALARDGYWIIELAEPRQRWVELLEAMDADFLGEFEFFHRAGPEGVATMTGLPIEAAAAANRREYSEPVQWLGTPARREAFIEALRAAGATVAQGGRFLAVSGDCSKGRALGLLRELFQREWQGSAVRDLAIGDGQNDVPMLEAAGEALLIRSPVNLLPTLARESGVLTSTLPGPEGWNEGVRRWLAQQQRAREA
jgi:mannosyl-3-phosphoglycerate phosphatase